MAKLSGNSKLALFVLVALVGGVAGAGYFMQSAKFSDKTVEDKAKDQEKSKVESLDQAVLAPKPNDIILGDNNAIVTMVEYSSLSCPHCAHFHEKMLPAIEKEFITTGKVKLVVRHFPLNEPAIKAAQIVECAGTNGLKREDFLKVFFTMQAKWAFSDAYLKDLKQIASVGGIDSAAFESCSNDKALETRILSMRLEGAQKLHITATPTFFINGVKYEGEPSVEGFRAAINHAMGQ